MLLWGLQGCLARPTSRCILFDGENISFDVSLVMYLNSTNIPPIMNINRIYETQNLLSLLLVSFLVGLRTYQHRCIMRRTKFRPYESTYNNNLMALYLLQPTNA